MHVCVCLFVFVDSWGGTQGFSHANEHLSGKPVSSLKYPIFILLSLMDQYVSLVRLDLPSHLK